jgi:intein/homing endonuclease
MNNYSKYIMKTMDAIHMRTIGSLGGKARVRLHGNPGTPEGRKRGGLESLKTHQRNSTAFKTLKRIRTPRTSTNLAELLGIFMGDGHVHTYQASVCTNSDTDMQHALHIKFLIESIFHLPASLSLRSDKKACLILISSKEVCRFLVSQGMPQGSKVRLGLTIPSWIHQKVDYRRSFLRGLIDTDGCVYQDRHTINGKHYSSTCIAFTSASPELREFVKKSFEKEGWNPTSANKDIRLRRKKEVHAYAKIIGFSNPKHSHKITL